MNNKQQIWAKTILVAYKYLNTMCGAIDRLVEVTAKNSFYVGGVWHDESSVLNISEKILKLADRKIDYINLKVLAEKILKAMPEKLAKILILKYIKQIKTSDIIEACDMSIRSYYRRQSKAIESFAEHMKRLGFYSEKIEQTFLNDMFIRSVYEEILNRYNSMLSNCDETYDNSRITDCIKKFETSNLVKIIV